MTFDTRAWLDEHRGAATLLGICPMSEEIVEATLREATDASDFVPMFIATPRQVDADRGYTGWSQQELVDHVNKTAATVGYDGPTIVARDHGGPYQSAAHRDDPTVSLDEAMAAAKDLFVHDLESGFDILHVDATEDARKDEILDLEEVTCRTTELIDAIESHRENESLPPVYYEVGTEEIDGGMTDPDDFECYIRLLQESLEAAGRGAVTERLLFVVGQIGTDMQINMQNDFDPEKARQLHSIVTDHDLFLKVHYTDFLDDAALERFPELGISAANVGPEFAAAMVEGYESLEALERDVIDDESDRSNFMAVFTDAAVRDAPWEKFAPDTLDHADCEAYVSDQRRNIAYCVGRYVFTDPAVRAARETLYENVARASDVNPHERVVETVRETIHRYVESFACDD